MNFLCAHTNSWLHEAIMEKKTIIEAFYSPTLYYIITIIKQSGTDINIEAHTMK